MQQVDSPFKFLAPYESKDKDSYWGREEEIESLYDMLFASNSIFIYGPSGTGKTSLVQCGLWKKFSSPDWIPLLIRRGENFNESLTNELNKILKVDPNISTEDHIIQIYNTYYRTVYLIFDQFEEVFTLAKKDEKGKVILNEKNKSEEISQLFQLFKRLRKKALPCKIILLMREEFLGQLYKYEEDLPDLFDFRLRVEPMNASKLNETIHGTFNYFNVKCEQLNTISGKLMEGGATGQLAYLQVYLDRLWKTAYAEQKPKTEGKEFPEISITPAIIDEVKNISDVLEQYLEEQEKKIANSLHSEVAKVREILDLFVTDNGTKQPILINAERLSTSFAIECLEKLQAARLVYKGEKYYELSHDALAGILNSKRTGEQRLIKNLSFNLRTNYDLYVNQNGGYLNEENVSLMDKYLEPIKDELNINTDVAPLLNYLDKSRETNTEKRQELEKKNRRLSFLNKVAIFLLIMAGVLGLFSIYWALNSSRNFNKTIMSSKVSLHIAESDHESPTQKLRLLLNAYQINKDISQSMIIENRVLAAFNTANIHQLREIAKWPEEDSISSPDKFVAFSPDSKWIVMEEKNKTKIINLKTIETLNNPDFGLYYQVFFSPDSKWILTRLNDDKDKSPKNYEIWELPHLIRVNTPQPLVNLESISFSMDSKYLQFSYFDSLKNALLIKNLDLEKKELQEHLKPNILFGQNLTKNYTEVNEITTIKNSNSANQYPANIVNLHSEIYPSNDHKKLVTIQENRILNKSNSKYWEYPFTNAQHFLDEEQHIVFAAFSLDKNYLWTVSEKNERKIWNISSSERINNSISADKLILGIINTAKGIRLLKYYKDKSNRDCSDCYRGLSLLDPETGNSVPISNLPALTYGISPNKEWLVWQELNGSTSASDIFRIYNLKKGGFSPSLSRVAYLDSVSFSVDNKWVKTFESYEEHIINLEDGKMDDSKINLKFSNSRAKMETNSKWKTKIVGHKVITIEAKSGDTLQTVWFNKIPNQTLIDNNDLYVLVGNAVIKTDLEKQKGNYFSYGDGEPLDYNFEEIQEWAKVFDNSLLPPLNGDLKKKVGLDVENKDLGIIRFLERNSSIFRKWYNFEN